MDKKLFLIGLFVVFSSMLYGQKEIPPFDSFHKNIYIEFLGSHFWGGINYDMRLTRGRMDGIGFRAGVGGFGASGWDIERNTHSSVAVVTFPLEFNHLLGKKRSSFVSGVGLIPVYVTFSSNGATTDSEFVRGEGIGLVGGFLTLGYRFQPRKTGVMFQINWNPLILRGHGFKLGWLGAGIGIGFK